VTFAMAGSTAVDGWYQTAVEDVCPVGMWAVGQPAFMSRPMGSGVCCPRLLLPGPIALVGYSSPADHPRTQGSTGRSAQDVMPGPRGLHRLVEQRGGCELCCLCAALVQRLVSNSDRLLLVGQFRFRHDLGNIPTSVPGERVWAYARRDSGVTPSLSYW